MKMPQVFCEEVTSSGHDSYVRGNKKKESLYLETVMVDEWVKNRTFIQETTVSVSHESQLTSTVNSPHLQNCTHVTSTVIFTPVYPFF